MKLLSETKLPTIEFCKGELILAVILTAISTFLALFFATAIYMNMPCETLQEVCVFERAQVFKMGDWK